MDLHFFYRAISEATARTAALVCLTSHYPQAIAIRAIEVMASRRQRGQDLGTVLSFMVSVLLGKVTKAKLEVHEGRHEALVIALRRAMYRVASPGEACRRRLCRDTIRPFVIHHINFEGIEKLAEYFVVNTIIRLLIRPGSWPGRTGSMTGIQTKHDLLLDAMHGRQLDRSAVHSQLSRIMQSVNACAVDNRSSIVPN